MPAGLPPQPRRVSGAGASACQPYARPIYPPHARAAGCAKRGDASDRITLSEAHLATRQVLDMDTLDQALTRLERLNRRQSQIVEMRFFAAPAERDARNLYQESLDDWRELRRRSPLDRQGLDEQRAVEAALSIGARTP